MARVPLLGGAYTARNLAVSAQRAVNLYAEPVPAAQGEPTRVAHYPMPGLRRLTTLPQSPVRGIRQASNGAIYAVAGDGVYRVYADWTSKRLGSITPGITAPVSMAENGLVLVIVDGSAAGWQVTLATDTLSVIPDSGGAFRGGGSVSYLDTYLLFSVPGTPQFYASDSLAVTFDPLWFANKEAAADQLVSLAVAKREIWLIGERSTEVWYNTGSADFPFGSMPGVFIDHGCAARASVCVLDNAVYWLGRNRRGQGVVLQGGGYQVTRVSTYAIETAIAGYGDISDAVGFAYLIAGHMFYTLTFPAADKTWCLDATTGLWSELVWIDADGAEHRHRANCAYLCGNDVVVGDWQTGALYALDPAVYTDDGQPMKRLRHFPHLQADGKRHFHRQFIADIACGDLPGDGALGDEMIYLSWSDDRGRSFGNPVGSTLGLAGRYLTQPQWQRLGMARDRVYALEWASPALTALLGAYVDAQAGVS